MRWVPTSSWKTMPEEMMGVIPSSISVPRLLAIIMRSQYNGSEVSTRSLDHASSCFAPLQHTGRHNAVQRHLAHHQEDDQGDAGPYYPLLKGHLRLRYLDLRNGVPQLADVSDSCQVLTCFRDDGCERLHEIEESKARHDCGSQWLVERRVGDVDAMVNGNTWHVFVRICGDAEVRPHFCAA